MLNLLILLNGMEYGTNNYPTPDLYHRIVLSVTTTDKEIGDIFCSYDKTTIKICSV